MGMHDGHRERMKKRFSEHGLASFSDIEALEMLLFYALPRKNTNEIAHHLLDRFGSFRGVLEADLDELRTVEGVGENAAALLRLVTEMNMRYVQSEQSAGRIMTQSEAAGEYLIPLYAYQKREMAYMLFLNSAGRLLCCRELARGIVNRVEFSARDIIEAAIKENAAKVVLSHNHLSGTALPSQSDIDSTLRIRDALKVIGIELSDHIIVCDDDFVSLYDSGYLKN